MIITRAWFGSIFARILFDFSTGTLATLAFLAGCLNALEHIVGASGDLGPVGHVGLIFVQSGEGLEVLAAGGAQDLPRAVERCTGHFLGGLEAEGGVGGSATGWQGRGWPAGQGRSRSSCHLVARALCAGSSGSLFSTFLLVCMLGEVLGRLQLDGRGGALQT